MADKKSGVSTISNTPSGVNHPNTTGNIPTVRTTMPGPAQSAAHRLADQPLFAKENYMWMIIGLAVIALGMFLMSGGKSADPNVFDQKEIYSARRITIAPFLIIIGLGIEVFAIFKKPKA